MSEASSRCMHGDRIRPTPAACLRFQASPMWSEHALEPQDAVLEGLEQGGLERLELFGRGDRCGAVGGLAHRSGLGRELPLHRLELGARRQVERLVEVRRDDARRCSAFALTSLK